MPCKSVERIKVKSKRLKSFKLIVLDYKINDWKTNEDGVEEREESYLFPLNIPISRAKETECYVILKLTKNIPGR